MSAGKLVAAGEMRLCPTRADGLAVRITHLITPAICQTRQRALYHKCFTCAHRNRSAPPAAGRNGHAGANGAAHASGAVPLPPGFSERPPGPRRR